MSTIKQCICSLSRSDTPARRQSCQHCTQDRWRQFEISWRDLFTICYICFIPPRDCGVASSLVWLIKVGPRHSYNQNIQHRKARVTQLVVHRHTIWIGNMGIFTIFLMHHSGLSFTRRGICFLSILTSMLLHGNFCFARIKKIMHIFHIIEKVLCIYELYLCYDLDLVWFDVFFF